MFGIPVIVLAVVIFTASKLYGVFMPRYHEAKEQHLQRSRSEGSAAIPPGQKTKALFASACVLAVIVATMFPVFGYTNSDAGLLMEGLVYLALVAVVPLVVYRKLLKAAFR